MSSSGPVTLTPNSAPASSRTSNRCWPSDRSQYAAGTTVLLRQSSSRPDRRPPRATDVRSAALVRVEASSRSMPQILFRTSAERLPRSRD
ncbi:hypothetical protein HBB16_09035 [Pseudonocardia sp. MCCB 268]|nr:hypothetical protein [Pseudonocardia cytotoxica]